MKKVRGVVLLAVLAGCSSKPGGGGEPSDSKPTDRIVIPGLDGLPSDAHLEHPKALHDGKPRDGHASDHRLLDSLPWACPSGMVAINSFCMDLYEAPNAYGALPLVMYSFNESDAWCKARGKRLCYDDEWTLACATKAGWSYPYGSTHVAGTCNDDKLWKTYNQTLLNGWPSTASGTGITTLTALFAAATAAGSSGAAAANHVQSIYQGEASGSNTGCTNSLGVFDLCGNVEEWTRRRDGGSGSIYHGNLKGRYWAESRTCQSGVTVHADPFRFYEIGFRCCKDQPGGG
jgi:hypothetical protein